MWFDYEYVRTKRSAEEYIERHTDIGPLQIRPLDKDERLYREGFKWAIQAKPA